MLFITIWFLGIVNSLKKILKHCLSQGPGVSRVFTEGSNRLGFL